MSAPKALIGIKGKHKEVIAILRKRIQELAVSDFVAVRELDDCYPAGDEQVLVYELTSRVVPEAGIPIQVGCVVVNTETALNIYHALNGHSVTETYLTVAGNVPRRLTLKVPVGTPIIDVLKLSGIEDFSNYRVIDGGPMMGNVLTNLDGFVTKTSKAYIILPKNHPLIHRKSITLERAKINMTCEQCRLCTDLCPRYLLGHNMQPHKIIRVTNYQIDQMKDRQTAFLCCECNLCELFACPIHIYPRSANVLAKKFLREKNIQYERKKEQFKPRKGREFRLVPSKRLIARLGLTDYDLPAPMTDETVVPDVVYIATKQHIGAKAEPIVSVGDHVKCGQLISQIPENKMGATIHASISGKVLK